MFNAHGGHLLMSSKERDRKAILEQVKLGVLNLKQASIRLHISYRQMKRIWRRYQQSGDVGLIHQSRGRPSHRKFDDSFRAQVLEHYTSRFMGFGPTFASEKLADLGLVLHADTLRGWLISEGLWHRKRKRKAHFQRRERRKRFGELLQLDGSIHRWFGPAGDYYCLMVLIDDATGIRHSHMAKGETVEATLTVLKEWIERYGIPQEIYVDLKTVYISPKGKASIEEQLKGIEDGASIFEQVCKRLGIKITKAYSPQAKGRVERAHGVYQDRLCKEIQLNKLNTVAHVNKFLSSDFDIGLNDKFAIEPADIADGHVSLQKNQNLEELICWEYQRQIQNDFTVRFKNQFYQLQVDGKQIKPKQKVIVRVLLDGSVQLVHNKQKLKYKQLKEKPLNKPKQKEKLTPKQRSAIARKSTQSTPWRQFNPGWLKQGKKKVSAIS